MWHSQLSRLHIDPQIIQIDRPEHRREPNTWIKHTSICVFIAVHDSRRIGGRRGH
ncbi:uncharacterized protein EI90DRAFT_3096147 [Cantharellus anzutake]|uniref:uncharacterized protein n=1 Tax=Cantharellus anzutake TaxID=1750568 RepID=UPI001908999C|nr:uncharacterized protein EI90DRAFT_3096147 [Cantharellus anzutake]KAF8311543.1 hypothetical protein EI90DRAFT_3096147 [Cantharellus anzutake]